MPFVEVKSSEEQTILSLLRTRNLIFRQRTQTITLLWRLLAELGGVLPKSVDHSIRLVPQGRHVASATLPEQSYVMIGDLCDALVPLHERAVSNSWQIAALATQDPKVARLQTTLGVGPITAPAITATIGSARQF